jgi:pseudouridine-5'-phosphate glycosidase
LKQLAESPVAVICAGVKSILDIRRTLEYLETQGVLVGAYGTDEFPAFFTAKSGFKAPVQFNDAAEIAKVIYTTEKLNLRNGMVIGVPIPDYSAANGQDVENAIRSALAEAKEKKISGRDVTPYILKRVNEITGGKSLKANIALLKNNAHVGASVAIELQKLKTK